MNYVGATPTGSDRQFTVAGLDNTKTYTVSFLPSANVTTVGGQTLFADTDQNNVADGLRTGNSVITVVNGAVASNPTLDTASPVSGTISFTLEGTATSGSVVPVVFLDSGLTTSQLDLVIPATANADPKAPAESFGVGGKTTYAPAAGTLGTHVAANVDAVDTTAKYYVASAATFTWDSNDVFQYSGVAITQAEFESMLNVNDTISSIYNPTASGVSTFNITVDIAVAPVAPTVAVVNLDAGATVNDVQVTFTDDAASSGTTFQLLDGGVVLTGTTQTVDADGVYVITKLNATTATHTYTVRAVSPVSGVFSTAGGTATTPATIAVPGASDTTAPFAVDAVITANSGLLGTFDTGDVFKVVFSEAIAAPVAGNAIRANDGDTTIADFVNGSGATFTRNAAAETVNGLSRPANTVLTVTLLAAPTTVTAGAPTGLQIPSTISDQSGIKDLAGNAWSLATSTDLVIDQDSVDNTTGATVTATLTAPATGAAAGSTAVTITGTNFSTDGTTTVTIGGVAATSVVVVNSTTITAVTGAHAAGAVNVVVVSGGSTGTETNGYTYV